MICYHGCGNEAKFQTKGGHNICEKTSHRCPLIRKKNSDSLKEAYASGKISKKDHYKNLTDEQKKRLNWNKGIKTGPNLKLRRPEESFFVEHCKRARHHVKARILDQNLIPYVCKICGQLPRWQGKPMILILDHENGIKDDNRIENLRFVCGNCELQLPTHSGRNVKKLKFARVM